MDGKHDFAILGFSSTIVVHMYLNVITAWQFFPTGESDLIELILLGCLTTVNVFDLVEDE